MATSTFSFGKQEKLKSRKLINQLFAEGKAISVAPLRLIYLSIPKNEIPVKMGVSASSRNFKKAVDRNRIKRLLRETYRLNKAELLTQTEASSRSLVGFIIYTDRSLPEFDLINQKMQVLLAKLIKSTGETAAKNT